MEDLTSLVQSVRTLSGSDDYDPWEDCDMWNSLTPMGWKFLGAGCSRAAWLAPDGQVYKILTREGSHYNYAEYEKCQELREQDFAHIYIPEADLIGDVLVMEYIDGDTPPECEYDGCSCDKIFGGQCWVDAVELTGLSDIHAYNVMVMGDMIIPIDLAV